MNIFRPEYRKLSEQEEQLVGDVKSTAQALYNLLPKTEDGRAKNREVSLAITKLEEAVMWAVKGITG